MEQTYGKCVVYNIVHGASYKIIARSCETLNEFNNSN